MVTATVTTHGLGQSVDLPEGFQLDVGEVYVNRVGRSVLLIPKDAIPWEILDERLDLVTDDFLRERNQPLEQQRAAMFEKRCPAAGCLFVVRQEPLWTDRSSVTWPSPHRVLRPAPRRAW